LYVPLSAQEVIDSLALTAKVQVVMSHVISIKQIHCASIIRITFSNLLI
jgi:hypothetical protein